MTENETFIIKYLKTGISHYLRNLLESKNYLFMKRKSKTS